MLNCLIFWPGTRGPLHLGAPGLCSSCPPHCYATEHQKKNKRDDFLRSRVTPKSGSVSYERLLNGVLHDLSPVVVDHLEHLTFLGHLLHNVLGREDRVEIQPLSLDLEPFVYRLLDSNHPLLPFPNLLLERLSKQQRCQFI